MGGRFGGVVVGAAAVLAAAMMGVPSSRLPIGVSLDLGADEAGRTWTGDASDRAALDLAAAPGLPAVASHVPMRARFAAHRLLAALTPEMAQNFRLFLYIDKSAHGPLAQRMFVFDRRRGTDLLLLHVWQASTGRERLETDILGGRTFSTTPAGYYELDPMRLYRTYRSAHWNEDMPYAMFFDRVENGRKTGLAIHAATGAERARLGTRASAGCVRLAPENARTLFELIRREYAGLAPRFAPEEHPNSPFPAAKLVRDGRGQLKLAAGYEVLVVIEEARGEDTLAALF